MILYNVTVKISHDKHDEWYKWMQEIHIPEVMETGLFVDQKTCRILHDEEDGVTYAFQYYSRNMDQFERYQQVHAKRLQDDHREKFGDHYVAFRTLMEVL